MTSDTRATWAAYEQQNRRVNPRTAPARPVAAPRPVAPTPQPRPTQAPTPSRLDQLLDRARQVPKLAKLVERHDQLLQQIEQRLAADEQGAREERKRQMAIEQAHEAAERARKDYETAQAKLRELGATKTGKPKRQLSEAQLTSLRANAEKARAAATAKREAAR